MQAQIVGATLQQRDAHRPADRARDRRQIAMEQLILQIARARRDDHAPARQQRRHEIRERLAGARARLDDQPPVRAQRERDLLGHRDLLLARREAGDRRRQRPLRSEQFVVVVHDQACISETSRETAPAQSRPARADCAAASECACSCGAVRAALQPVGARSSAALRARRSAAVDRERHVRAGPGGRIRAHRWCSPERGWTTATLRSGTVVWIGDAHCVVDHLALFEHAAPARSDRPRARASC